MTNLSFLLYAFLVVIAGISVAIQQVLNANLRAHIGSTWWAGFTSYFVGVMVMLIIALTTSPITRLTDAFNNTSSWYTWIGGLFGAIFIAICILMIPKLGATTTIVLIVVGQMVGSMTLDHFGLFGLSEQPMTMLKLTGATCLLLGVILIRI
ncbi:DMT family transporter [Ampullimonas aquatilis]|uniref:DMT family transporter n=1 Tax=Ampullimonas aquatilis TaxID=1341549 RepID=UPI003C707DC7